MSCHRKRWVCWSKMLVATVWYIFLISPGCWVGLVLSPNTHSAHDPYILHCYWTQSWQGWTSNLALVLRDVKYSVLDLCSFLALSWLVSSPLLDLPCLVFVLYKLLRVLNFLQVFFQLKNNVLIYEHVYRWVECGNLRVQNLTFLRAKYLVCLFLRVLSIYFTGYWNHPCSLTVSPYSVIVFSLLPTLINWTVCFTNSN